MKSTMKDAPLSISRLLEHAARVHPDAEVVTADARTAPVAVRSPRSPSGPAAWPGPCATCGVDGDQRVAHVHVEQRRAPGGVPGRAEHGRGAAHAEHPAVPRPAHLHRQPRRGQGHHRRREAAPAARQLLPTFETVNHVVVVGGAADADLSELEATGKTILRYEELLARRAGHRLAGDRRDRRGRAVLHVRHDRQPEGRGLQPPLDLPALDGGRMADAFGLTPYDRILPIVPMFHAKAWGLPYAAFMAGASLVMPDRFLQAAPLAAMIEAERPTVGRRRADDLERPARLPRRHTRPTSRRSGGAVRRLGCAARAACGRSTSGMASSHPRLGHDRDVAARPPSRCRRRASTRTARTAGATATPRAGVPPA